MANLFFTRQAWRPPSGTLYWMDRPMADLSREELLEVVAELYEHVEGLRADRDRWRSAGDPLAYMLMPSPASS